jgi:hypothetical protein
LKVKKRLKAQYGRESAGSRELDDKEVKAVSHPTEVIHPAMSAPIVKVTLSDPSAICGWFVLRERERSEDEKYDMNL